MHKFLVIQTAFIGDVVLATAVVEKLNQSFPGSEVHFLLRKGNETLLQGHPGISKVLVWNKQQKKKRNLLAMAMQVRREKYTHVINIHRHFTSGLTTLLSGAGYRAGFDTNPLSFCFTHKVKHVVSPVGDPNPVMEIQRNQELIAPLTGHEPAMPRLHPTVADFAAVKQYSTGQYICIAPSSVWFTKRYPAERWVELINLLPAHYQVYIIGGPGDQQLANNIIQATVRKASVNLCGKFSLLQSAALMKGAVMNYANDSGPLHFAGAMNAPVTGVFCSTVKSFGFFPTNQNAHIVEIQEALYCRPCGMHGHQKCPEGHFRCAKEITNDQLLWWTSKTT